MAKDTANTGKDSSGNEFDRTTNDVVKKGLEKNAQRSDEKIIAQSRIPTKKDAKGNVIPPSPALVAEKNKITEAGNTERLSKGIEPGNVRLGPLTKAQAADRSGDVKPDIAEERKLSPKPTIEPLSLGKETARSKRNVGTGRKERTGVLDFGKLPSRPEGASNPASVNATARPEVASNVIDRMKSGMGLPGSENGDLDLALKLHARDLQTAKSTGKVVNDVSPNDPPATQHVHVYGGHHAAYARVMRVMGIADEEVYKNAASAAGMRLPAYIAGLHGKVVQHETSKKTMTHKLSGDEYWEHPKTKEIIPVEANHPDMPSSFTRSEGVINKVTRGADGSEVMDSGYSGWDKTKTRGGKGGQEVLRYSAGPTKGVDMIDHLRVQMLSEHGSSRTSRKKGANIANDIADVASGAVPRGMQRSGKRKVADEGFGKEKYVDNYVPANRPPNPRAFDKPQAPGVKGLTSRNAGRDTSAIQDGTYLLGTEELYDQNPTVPDFKSKGPKMVQDKLPGTGVPKYITSVTKKAVYEQKSGPLTKEQKKSALYKTRGEAYLGYEKQEPTDSQKEKGFAEALSKTPKGGVVTSKAVEEESKKLMPARRTKFYDHEKTMVQDAVKKERTVLVSPAETKTEMVLTDRDDTSRPARDLNRGQQFAIDTTDMTGAQEVSALRSKGALAGKKPKKTKPMEQPTLFPDFSVKEGRKNAFYMAGSVVQASEATKQLQADSKRRFGRKEDAIAIQGKYSGADDSKLEQPAGSRAANKSAKQLASEEQSMDRSDSPKYKHD
jgi:hypothetical protein